MRKDNLDGAVELGLCAFKVQQESSKKRVKGNVFQSLDGRVWVWAKRLGWSRKEGVGVELFLEELNVLDVVFDVELAVEHGVNNRFLAAGVDVVP